MSVHTGIDVLKLTGYVALQNRRVGLLTHVAACDNNLTPTYAVLANARNVQLKALFSPEHGLLSTAPDGAHVGHSVDAWTKLPVHSLYGDTKKPTAEMLEDIDLIVVDLQDVGARFYTYLWTMSYMLEACAEHDIEVLVLDRPNPLGGVVTAGMTIAPGCESFVGRFADALPVIYGLTIGEVARFINTECLPKAARLTVLSVSGWRRSMLWPDTGLPWIPPSPAMPHFSSVLQYPGAALLEGTTLSEGRGTALPFEVVGAPGINAFELAERLNAMHLLGVRFRPHAFRPTASKHAGQDCQGVQVHVTDHRYFNPLRVWLNVIVTVRALYPDIFDWIEPVNGRQHFDLLFGTTTARAMIDADARVDDLLADERHINAQFEERRVPYLLYG